jgi:uncharacterized RDD family membrane protein YckC
VVLRGLERHRERRWRSLDDFRQALLPFAPGHLSIGGMGVRLGAYLIDYYAISILAMPLSFALFMLTRIDPATDPLGGVRPPVMAMTASLWLLYFGLTEGLAGCSPGKWLLRLRVATSGGDRPSVARSLLRALVFFGLLHSGTLLLSLVAVFLYPPPQTNVELTRYYGASFQIVNFLPVLGFAVGLGLVLLPMRSRNGYRGLHEILTDTRVVRLPWPERRRSYASLELDSGLARPAALPAKVGPFVVLGAVRWDAGDQIVLGDDAALERRMWLWLRPPEQPELSATRRALARAGRPRWLARGHEPAFQGDAFMVSAGSPLPDLIRQEGRLAWADARPLLEQLTEELAAAQTDQTLPSSLTRGQVWIQPNGGLQLLDFPPEKQPPAGDRPAQPGDKVVTGRIRPFLYDCASLMLQGSGGSNGACQPIRAPLPRHAAQLLDCLTRDQPDDTLDDFQARLKATRELPVAVTGARRAAHLAFLFLVLSVGLSCLFVLDWAADFAVPLVAVFQTPAAEQGLTDLDRGSARAIFLASASPDPWLRLTGTLKFSQDLELRDRLQQYANRMRRLRQDHIQAFTWYTRQMAAFLGRSAEAQQAAVQSIRIDGVEGDPGDFRTRARRLAEDEIPLQKGRFFFSGILPCILLAWPAAWVVWALVTRGGFSLWLLGLSLVRGDGRPALRLQCAWRALLVWLPLTALLLLSAWCNATYWANWPDNRSAALLWLSCLAYWGAMATLFAYAALAVWMPERSLHDCLAGTYLVSR